MPQGVGQGLESLGNQMADPSCCFPEDTGSHRRLLSWRSSRPNGLVSDAYQIRAPPWGLKFVREFTRCVSVDRKMRRRDRLRCWVPILSALVLVPSLWTL